MLAGIKITDRRDGALSVGSKVRFPRSLLLILVVLSAAANACAGPRPGGGGAADLPQPDISRMEPEVRRQLEERRQVLAALDADRASPAELAEAIGGLGQSYHAYDLTAAAAACYEEARRLAPEEFRWAYLLGFVRQNRGELDAAAESLEAALSMRPDDVPALARLAAIRLRQGRDPAAGGLLERALELDPSCAVALRGLGEIALRRGGAGEAVERFRAALALQPQAASLRFLLASALRESGDEEGAARQLELWADVPVEIADPLAEEVFAEASGASAWLLRGHTSLKEGRLSEAVVSYRRAVALDPDNVAGREALAFALADVGDARGSMAELRRLVAGGGGSARAHFLLGRLLAAGGDDLAALEHYRHAAELDPADENALFNTASTLARLGRFEEAAEQYSGLLLLDPLDAVARYRRALLLEALGRGAEALAELERAAADDPGNEEIRARLLAMRNELGPAE